MKLTHQVFTATIPNVDSGGLGGDTFAEVRLSYGDKWTGTTIVNPGAVGLHDAMKGAQTALAKALRALADKVESDA